MPAKIYRLLLTCLLTIAYKHNPAQTQVGNLQFRSSQGLRINVHKGDISVNGKRQFHLNYDDIIYSSKRNRLLEDSGSIFLFLEIDGSPNRNRLYVFQVSANHVDSLCDAISSDLKDLDGDGYLEFGGTDLTEGYPNRDSMYYIPSRYYEIRAGHILPDIACTKKMDIQTNGVYLAEAVDKDGYCCKVIPKPASKKTYIVVEKNVPQDSKSSPAETSPEKVISQILAKHKSFYVADLEDFIEAFKFDVSMEDHYSKLKGYYLDEDRVNGTSCPMRMFLVFDGSDLMGVVHKRPLINTGLKEMQLSGGYLLAVQVGQGARKVDVFIKKFNDDISKFR